MKLGIYVIHLPTISGPDEQASIIENRVNPYFHLPLVQPSTNPVDQPVVKGSMPTESIWIPYIVLCSRLNEMYQRSSDMALKSLICSHLLCLFVQSSLDIRHRLVTGISDPLINEYFTLFVSSIQGGSDFPLSSLLDETSTRYNGVDLNLGINICDLWDGKFLSAIHGYCSRFTHAALFLALPTDSKNCILANFPPAVFHEWNNGDLPVKCEFISDPTVFVRRPPVIQVCDHQLFLSFSMRLLFLINFGHI